VEVVNGGFGRSVRGDSSIDLTVSGVPLSELVSAVACASSRSRMSLSDFSLTAPSAPKSLVAATFLPSTESKRAAKPRSVFALRSHQED
jgi:hypothetical protein